MSIQKKDSHYQAFLLRCWQSQPDNQSNKTSWRFSLRDVSDEPQEIGFSDLEQLVKWLTTSLNEEQGLSL